MDKRARVRWTVLLAALAATVCTIWMLAGEGGVAVVSAPALRRPAIPPQMLAESDTETPTDDGLLGGGDPFAPRGWGQPAPPPPAPVVQAEAVAVAPLDLTPQAPVLPFRFVGSMNDNAEQLVYLARGEQALVARTGDVLEGTYRVLAITQGQIEFEYIPTGVKQTLTLPARDN
ncbi:hypothetical protein LPN04_27395 [Rugamonas sp. A1-17]|nr:hypothetical protein [Rugamonas sp. A1-17]